MNLRWTNAGRAALASAAHVGTAAVKLTHLALGDDSGPGGAADDARAALRNERHRAAIAGTEAAAGRIAFRADFAPDASYSITEVGVFGTVGDPPGATQLLLHWTDGGTEAGKAASGTALAIAAVIEFQDAAAEVTVTVGGNIVFGATEPATEAAFGSTRYATGEETGAGAAGNRSVTPKGLKAGAGKVLGALVAGGANDGTIYQFKGDASGALIVEERTQDGASSAGIAANVAAIVVLAGRLTDVEGKTLAATAERKGIVELATQAEIEAGTSGALAIAPDGLEAALPKVVAGLKDSPPEAGEKLILEGVAGGGVKVVSSPFEIFALRIAVDISARTAGRDLLTLAPAHFSGLAAAGRYFIGARIELRLAVSDDGSLAGTLAEEWRHLRAAAALDCDDASDNSDPSPMFRFHETINSSAGSWTIDRVLSRPTAGPFAIAGRRGVGGVSSGIPADGTHRIRIGVSATMVGEYTDDSGSEEVQVEVTRSVQNLRLSGSVTLVAIRVDTI